MNAPPEVRILLVEDSPTDALLIKEALSDVLDFQHHLFNAGLLSDALNRIQSTQFDIVLLDLGLPDAQGIGTFRTFQHHAAELPVLVLTGLDDMSVGLRAIQEGAQDYLSKRDISSSELGRAIRYAIERHQIAMALKESEERFQLAVSGASAGLWDWNVQTGAVYLSTQFQQIMGYEGHELPNESQLILDLIHPDDIERVRAQLAAHLAQRCTYEIEYRIRVRTGEYRWMHARGQALWNQSGEAYRMVGWIIDVTERRLADEALRESREELKRLSASIQRAREEEKTRIARELHDDLGQQLAALKIECSKYSNRAKDIDTTKETADMSNIYSLIDQLVVSVRRIATDLRPAMLDDLGLLSAIEWFIERFSSRYAISVVQHIDAEDIDFNHDSSTAVFRIVQEALTNVARHASATQVTLEIASSESHCIVRIADNGHGCRSDVRPSPSSFGLIGMRERVAALSGELTIQTAPGQGFALTVLLPLSAVEAKSL
ncbi:Sensory box histidine kinase/response regulator [Paraburkholderia caribensis]|uniref:hybrid sensor histidine kinase/response regulator n=1 Tax=Paraburkholderia caribensis TaxID=75105 RepID=UPI001CB32945|nr:PAS domain-containing protein [Paraburkholderia caribensis]CAG9239528.1 Sensory box histidine kinase/response regulator [Paraburkholderia caribensis]